MLAEHQQDFFVVELIFEILFGHACLYFIAFRAKNRGMPVWLYEWCPHQDSNADLLLRTELFYPLNYGGEAGTHRIRHGRYWLSLASFCGAACATRWRSGSRKFRLPKTSGQFLAWLLRRRRRHG